MAPRLRCYPGSGWHHAAVLCVVTVTAQEPDPALKVFAQVLHSGWQVSFIFLVSLGSQAQVGIRVIRIRAAPGGDNLFFESR